MYVYLSLMVAVLPYLLYLYFTRTFSYWKKRGVVGPEPVPFFGNLKESFFRHKNVSMVYQEIYENYPNEKVVGIYRMTTPCLIVRDLDILKHIMIKDFDAFADRGIEFSKEGLGANLFHADGETWQVLRNRFTPIFTSGKLKSMLYLMNERADKYVQYIESICEKQSEQEMHSLNQKYTVSTISACAFGLDVNSMEDKMDSLKKVDKLVLTPNFAQELDMMYPGILKSLNMSLLPKFVKDTFESLSKKVISDRNGMPSNRKDFMDLILELRQQGKIEGTKKAAGDRQLTLDLTDDVITAQAFVFYIAGYETSATTMTFMLYELAKNPEVQDKLLAEIDEVLERHNGQTTYEALNEMTYFDNVFNETLRMYALAELLRKANTNYKVPGTNLTIEKGTTIIISSGGIQRDEKYFPNPNKFDPDRFSVENSKGRHPCAHLPFGTGPRNCIGKRFAKFQSRVGLAKLFSKFRVEVSNKTPEVISVDPNRNIINHVEGIYLNLVRRT